MRGVDVTDDCERDTQSGKDVEEDAVDAIVDAGRPCLLRVSDVCRSPSKPGPSHRQFELQCPAGTVFPGLGKSFVRGSGFRNGSFPGLQKMEVKIRIGKSTVAPYTACFRARLLMVFHTAGDMMEDVGGDEEDI